MRLGYESKLTMKQCEEENANSAARGSGKTGNDERAKQINGDVSVTMVKPVAISSSNKNSQYKAFDKHGANHNLWRN